MPQTYAFTDHFISFFSFVFLPNSHPVTEPIANTEYKKCVAISLTSGIRRYTINIRNITLLGYLVDSPATLICFDNQRYKFRPFMFECPSYLCLSNTKLVTFVVHYFGSNLSRNHRISQQYWSVCGYCMLCI